jgi:hypothetical protein
VRLERASVVEFGPTVVVSEHQQIARPLARRWRRRPTRRRGGRRVAGMGAGGAAPGFRFGDPPIAARSPAASRNLVSRIAYFVRAGRCEHGPRHEGDFGNAKHRRFAPARRHGVRLTRPTNSLSLQVIR